MRAFREDGFPITIVRPSLTYSGYTRTFSALRQPGYLPYTAGREDGAGKPVVVPGDGTSLWTITHNSDFAVGFVGLLGPSHSASATPSTSCPTSLPGPDTQPDRRRGGS